MPSVETSKIVYSLESQKTPDFTELQKQKEELFKEIEEKSLELSQPDKCKIVGLVSGHGIKDGFELARRLGLDGKIFAVTAMPHAAVKNSKFAKEFSRFVEKNKSYVKESDREFYLKVIKESLEDKDVVGKGYTAEDWDRLEQYPYASQINDYYSNFIRNRKLESPELPEDPRTQIEAAAEEHLLSAEAMLKESYYTGPVRKLLGLETEEDLENLASAGEPYAGNELLFEDQIWTLRADLIDRDMLIKILNRRGVDFDDKEVARVIRRARYAPSGVVFEERKKEAVKGLLEGHKQEMLVDGKLRVKTIYGLKQSIMKRGYKEDEFEIIFNEEKGEWEVVEKGGKKESGETEDGKENLRKIEDVPNVISIDNNDEYFDRILKERRRQGENVDESSVFKPYSDIHILDGEVYNQLHNAYHNSDFIIYPDGTRSEIFLALQNVRMMKRGIAFLVNDAHETEGNNNFQLCLNGKRLNIDNDWQSTGMGILEDKEGSIYWEGVCVKDIDYSGADSRQHGIFKNDQLIKDVGSDGGIKLVRENNGEITYTKKGKSIYIGDKEFGPYDSIMICKNSKDKLIYYAKKDDKHFVYVDGDEKNIPVSSGEIFLDICKTQDNIYFLGKAGGMHLVHYLDTKGRVYGHILEHYKNISNFSEVDGKLFCITTNQNDDKYVQWLERGSSLGHKDGISVNLNNNGLDVETFENRVFIANERRVLSLRYGETEFKELTFDGDVELINSAGRLFIIESLSDRKRIWEYSEKLELQEREQKDLDLANAVVKEDLPAIKGYFRKYYPEEGNKFAMEKIQSGLKRALEQSKNFVGTVNQTIREVPGLFLDTLRAKNDKPTEFLMSQMFYYIFPEAQGKREKAMKEAKEINNPWNAFGGGGGGSGRGGNEGNIDYDSGINNLESVDEAGYYEMLAANREVLKLREPLPEATFITRGLFGSYTGSGWRKVDVPISEEVQDPAKETTFEFVDEKAGQNINLPKIANAKIITERLKGVTAKNEEVPIKIIEENNLGEVRVAKDKETKRITYSQTYSEMPKTMAEVTATDYDKFRKEFERSFSEVMTTPIGDIGDDLDIFVAGLKGKSPREQVIAIQEFCYEYGYYNLDNKPRDTDNFEERLSIMEYRMNELKDNDQKLAHKMYAGICTDFATLTTALLRKAGFVSGIASGFVSEAGSTVVKTNTAHAVSFVLWPNPGNKEGKPDMIIVDGTPSSITPRILEQEKKAAEMSEGLSIDAEKELEELERILKTMDVEAIKKLQNGQLEKTLNHILYGVKQSHVDVMNRVLNASRYAGFDILEMSRGNIEEQIEFRKFLEGEIYNEKGLTHDNRERRGEELFSLMLEFTRRFEKDKNVKDKEEALDVLEKIFDISEKYLNPVEVRSAVATITYLRASKMR